MKGVTFKMPLVNPWTKFESVAFPLPPITSRPEPALQRALRPRAYSLMVTQAGLNGSSLVTTMIFDGFTL